MPRLSRLKTSEVDDASMWNVFAGMSIRSNIVIEICFRGVEWGARSPNHIFGGVEVRANPSEYECYIRRLFSLFRRRDSLLGSCMLCICVWERMQAVPKGTSRSHREIAA